MAQDREDVEVPAGLRPSRQVRVGRGRRSCGARAAACRSLDVNEEVALENELALLVLLARLICVVLRAAEAEMVSAPMAESRRVRQVDAKGSHISSPASFRTCSSRCHGQCGFRSSSAYRWAHPRLRSHCGVAGAQTAVVRVHISKYSPLRFRPGREEGVEQ